MTLRLSLRRLALVLLAFVAVIVLLVLFHRPLLSAAAAAWIVDSHDFERVDLVIIPGGGFETRPFGAAELFREGRAERLAVFETEVHPTVAMGIRPPDHEVCLAVLKELNVPAEAVITLGDEVTSTWDEVEATRQWCAEHKPRAIAVVTEVFSTRRVRYAYEKGLKDLSVDVHVVAVPATGYTSADWWLDERGLIAFQNEVVKWGYYRLK
jgi:uncharacterized SAM-binding protein YcdF (DUF218 family)